ncbi:amidoligase family protein [Candidatus Dojkabacteria bacterium]|jgi:hypothetical protein|nr:amidoligase family protein [Candidatus Dojkabacteria bacterium]
MPRRHTAANTTTPQPPQDNNGQEVDDFLTVDIDDEENNEEEVIICQRCDEETESDYMHYVETADGEKRWCESCFENYSFYCAYCENNFDMDFESYHEIDDDYYCNDCISEHFIRCATCETLYGVDEITEVLTGTRSIYICPDCVNDNAFKSAYSGLLFHNSLKLSVLTASTTRITSVNVATTEIDMNPRDFGNDVSNGRIMLRRSPTYDSNTNTPTPLSRQYPHRSLPIIQNSLRQKVLQEMGNRPSPSAPPVHDKIYIGVELEAQAGHYFVDQPNRLLSTELPDTKIVRDGSIVGEGMEFLPPVVKHKKGWDKIQKLIQTLKDFKWTADKSCGLHLHLSHGKMNADNPQIIRDIFRAFYWLEPFIFACLPIERRNNKYCYPISKYFNEKDITPDLKLDYWYYSNFWKKQIQRSDGNHRETHYDNHGDPISFGQGKYRKTNMDIDKREHYYVGRYIGCNLHALFQKGTLELRYFPAIIDFDYIYNWAEIVSRIVMNIINGFDVKQVEHISKNSSTTEKTIKKIAKIFKLSTKLENFLKMEFRKYKKSPHLPVPERQQHLYLNEINTEYEDSITPSTQDTETEGAFEVHTQATRITRAIDDMTYTDEQYDRLVTFFREHHWTAPLNENDMEIIQRETNTRISVLQITIFHTALLANHIPELPNYERDIGEWRTANYAPAIFDRHTLEAYLHTAGESNESGTIIADTGENNNE